MENERPKRKYTRKNTLTAYAKKKKFHMTTIDDSPFTAIFKADRYRIVKCICEDSLLDESVGLGKIIIARKISAQKLLAATFLIDRFCLGIKEITLQFLNQAGAEELLSTANPASPAHAIAAPCAAKIVIEAEAYARNLGFRPPESYEKVSMIFAKIDPLECLQSIQFGKNGKPYYVSSKTDSPETRNDIRATLARSVGEGNFEFIIESEVKPVKAALPKKSSCSGQEKKKTGTGKIVKFPSQSKTSATRNSKQSEKNQHEDLLDYQVSVPQR